ASPVVLGKRRDGEVERPALDVRVVDDDDERQEQAEHTEILGCRMLPDCREHPWQVGLAVTPAIPAQAPLNPDERKAEQQECYEVGDHEAATAIRSGLRRESQEVAKAYGISCHGENEAHPAAPCFVRVRSA